MDLFLFFSSIVMGMKLPSMSVRPTFRTLGGGGVPVPTPGFAGVPKRPPGEKRPDVRTGEGERVGEGDRTGSVDGDNDRASILLLGDTPPAPTKLTGDLLRVRSGGKGLTGGAPKRGDGDLPSPLLLPP